MWRAVAPLLLALGIASQSAGGADNAQAEVYILSKDDGGAREGGASAPEPN
jgi:hypothetical protein